VTSNEREPNVCSRREQRRREKMISTGPKKCWERSSQMATEVGHQDHLDVVDHLIAHPCPEVPVVTWTQDEVVRHHHETWTTVATLIAAVIATEIVLATAMVEDRETSTVEQEARLDVMSVVHRGVVMTEVHLETIVVVVTSVEEEDVIWTAEIEAVTEETAVVTLEVVAADSVVSTAVVEAVSAVGLIVAAEVDSEDGVVLEEVEAAVVVAVSAVDTNRWKKTRKRSNTNVVVERNWRRGTVKKKSMLTLKHLSCSMKTDN